MSKVSYDQALSLSAAGRNFQLGMVYDANKNKLFESLNLFPHVNKKSRPCPSLSLDLRSSHTINERIGVFRFDGHAKVSVAFGLLNLGSASAKYIHDISSSITQARMTLQYKQTKRYEELDTATVLKLSGNHELLKLARESGATHFVAGMTYGNQVFIDFKCKKREEKEHELLNNTLRGLFCVGQLFAGKLNKDNSEMSKLKHIDCVIFCESKNIEKPESFEKAKQIYQDLPKSLENVEAVDSVYLLPLSFVDKDATKFKQSDIDEVTIKSLIDIRDDLYEQEMQCHAMNEQGFHTSQIMDEIRKYTDELKCTLSSTGVKRWKKEVVKHKNSRFHMQKFQKWMKQTLLSIAARTCRRCNLECATEKELCEHMGTHEARSCRRCFIECATENEFAEHMRKHEARTCRRCNLECGTESELAEHMRKHEARTCRRCNLECGTASEFAEHMRTHEEVHGCPFCKMKFATGSELDAHIRSFME